MDRPVNYKVTDTDTGDTLFEVWIDSEGVTLDIHTQESPGEPFGFPMAHSVAENLVSVLSMALSGDDAEEVTHRETDVT